MGAFLLLRKKLKKKSKKNFKKYSPTLEAWVKPGRT
jgi:hypothetical protein